MCLDPQPQTPGLSRRHALLGGLAAAGGVSAATLATASPASAAAADSSTKRDMDFALVPLGIQGGPPPRPNQAGISTALVVNGKIYLVDCGRASLTQYVNAGLPVPELRSIFLTHLHADHCIDFGTYTQLAAQFPTKYTFKEPIHAYGPGSAGAPSGKLKEGDEWANNGNPTPGTAEMLALLNQAFSGSANFFLKEHFIRDPAKMIIAHDVNVPAGAGAGATNTAPDIRPFPVMEDENVRVTATLVPHGAVYPALAYRFDTQHGSVVFSGDTAPSTNLIALAKDCDVLVHEAVELESSATRMGWNETTMKHMREVHTDVGEIGRIAKDANAGSLVLTHLVPDVLTHQEWNAALRKSVRAAGYTGRATVAQELKDVPL